MRSTTSSATGIDTPARRGSSRQITSIPTACCGSSSPTSALDAPAMAMTQRLRIVLLGYIVRCPLGGMAWHYLQYLMGLADLGHEVLYLEDSDDYVSCYDPSRHVTDTDPAYGLDFATDAFERLGFAERWAFYDAHRDRWHGPRGGDATRFCKEA